MGKSSSSSSSSDSSDDENKRWKKEQKRQKKLQKYGPGYQKQHKKGKKGKHGKAYGAPGQFNVGGAPNPYGGGAPIQYPGGPPAGPPGGAGYPQSGYPGQQQGAYPPQPGYPQGPGGPGFSSAPGYPPQPGGGPELGFGGPPAASGYPPAGGAYPPAGGAYPPAGGAYPPAGGAYPPAPGAGGLGFDMPSGYSQPPGGGYPPAQSGYGGPPGASFPGQPGAPPSQPAGPPAQGGYPGQPPTGYPHQSAGAPPAQAGYGTQAGYGAQTGYGAQPGAPPPGGPYGAQPTGAPPGGYASKPVSQPPVSQPPAAGYQQQQPSSQPARPPPPTGAAQPSASSSIAGQFSKMTVMGTAENYEGTITAAPSFDAEKDANVLRTAMKGMGTDEAAIIEVVRNRSNVQRQQIKKLFKTMFGKDLIKELQGELSGNFRECIMALFEPTIFYDAWSLNQAMMGLGTKEGVLIEILCTRTNAEIQAIVKCYKEYFRRDLEKDIVDDTSGHFKRLLVSCCQANRTELTPAQWERVMREGPECVVDRAMAKREAEELFRAGEKKIGTDESTFNRILALRHFYQLRATFEEYAKVSQRDILNSIGREMSGDLESGFKALIMSIKNRPEYFAERLYKSMKGAGTNDSTLIRVVVSRSEIDLKQIKQVFFQKYQKTLAKFIEQDTSGDYKKMLVGIVGYDW